MTRRAGLWAGACFLALAVALFPDVLTGRSFFHYDAWMQNLPFRAWWFAQLRDGHFATWCPGLFAGFPLFAETQTGPLYPPTFLLFLLLPATAAYSGSVVLHVALAGWGAWFLARRLGADGPGAALSGVVLALSGFVVAHVVHLNLLTGAALMPWAVALAWDAGRRSLRRSLALAAVLGAMLLGSHPYAVLMTGMLCALAVVGGAGRDARALVRGGARVAGALLLAAAIAAVQLLPARELIDATPRGQPGGWAFLTFGSFEPWRVPLLAAPDLCGSPVDGTYWGGPDGSHWVETCAYLGLVPVALAAAALVLRRDAATAFLGWAASLSFVLLLGKHTVAYRVMEWIPVLSSTRLPARFALPFTLATAVLAGLGLTALRAERSGRRRRAAIAVGAGGVLFLAGWAAWALGEARTPDALLRETGRWWPDNLEAIRGSAHAASVRLGIALAACLAALSLFARERVPRSAALAVIAVATVELWTFARPVNPRIPAEWITEPPPAVAALPRAEPRPRIARQGVDEVWSRAGGPPRTDPFTPAWKGNEETYGTAGWTLTPNSQLLHGVDSADGFTSLAPLAWLEWMGLPGARGAWPRPDLTEAQADLLAIDAVISTGAGIAGAGWEGRELPGGVFVSRNADPLPRVRLAGTWDTVSDRTALLERVRARTHDPRAGVLLEEAPAGLPPSARWGAVDLPLEAREAAPGRWEIRVPPGEAGIVVVAESWDPGWSAVHESGERVPVFRAEGLFAAFAAPESGGRFTLKHAPGTVRAGAAISLAALAAFGGLLAVTRRRHRPPSPPDVPGGPLRNALPVAAAAALVLCSALLGGGWRAERAAGSLEAAAVRAWTVEALSALEAGDRVSARQLVDAARRLRPEDARLAAWAERLGREAGGDPLETRGGVP